MSPPTKRPKAAAGTVLTLVAIAWNAPALANSLTPAAGFIPGLMPLGLWLALPASVLAAIIERPFVRRAGVTHLTLWHSLRANFLSLLIGWLTMPLAMIWFGMTMRTPDYAAEAAMVAAWSLAAVTLSIISESAYYRKWSVDASVPWNWGWVIGANALSNLILLLVPLLAGALPKFWPTLPRELLPYENGLINASVALSLGLFAISWITPKLSPQASRICDDQREAEFIDQNLPPAPQSKVKTEDAYKHLLYPPP